MIYTDLENKKTEKKKGNNTKVAQKKETERTYKILIAEDEEALANALSLKLKSVGYAVDLAVNGIEALDLMEKSSYDLILLDLLMPLKDGFDVLEELKERKHPPIIILSNLSQEEDIERTKELGAKDFWIKSNFQLAQIVEFLNKHFSAL